MSKHLVSAQEFHFSHGLAFSSDESEIFKLQFWKAHKSKKGKFVYTI